MPTYTAPAAMSPAPQSLEAIQEDIADMLKPQTSIRCLKCKMELTPTEQACPRCGLVLTGGRPELIKAWADPLAGHAMGDTLRQKWHTLSGDLENEAGHMAFISLCASQKILTYAGHCYRALLDADPDNQRAEDYRQQVIRAALAQAGHLDAQVSRVVAGPKRNLGTIAVGAVILLIFAIGYYLITRSQTAWQF